MEEMKWALFVPNLGGPFKGLFGGGGYRMGGKITPQVWYESTHTYVLSENISFNTKTL